MILAGGYGTRISEETHVLPKPMVEIGGKPILWHIMKLYSFHGVNEFIICLGYKSYVIKEYFANYFLHMSDVTFDMKNNSMEVHQQSAEPWKVTLVDTGLETQTGGRLKRIRKYIGDEDFCLTYGDGVSDVNISKLIDFHKTHNKLATLTAINLPSRFGILQIQDSLVTQFQEKPCDDESWISGGYFVLSPKVLEYIEEDSTIWEQAPLKTLAQENNLEAYKHTGFWQAMDTLREKNLLQKLWQENKAPWKVW